MLNYYSKATPTLFCLIQMIRQLRVTRSFSVISRNRFGTNEGFGTSMAAPSAETFSTRQRVLDPQLEIYAGSSTSVRGCFRLSSISSLLLSIGSVQVAKNASGKAYNPPKIELRSVQADFATSLTPSARWLR